MNSSPVVVFTLTGEHSETVRTLEHAHALERRALKRAQEYEVKLFEHWLIFPRDRAQSDVGRQWWSGVAGLLTRAVHATSEFEEAWHEVEKRRSANGRTIPFDRPGQPARRCCCAAAPAATRGGESGE